MRPKKVRWVKCLPGERCFQPVCKAAGALKGVCLSVDEFEALRLADLEGLYQVDAARLMKVSRPTFARIVTGARAKVADALVNIKVIRVGGACGSVKIRRGARGGTHG